MNFARFGIAALFCVSIAFAQEVETAETDSPNNGESVNDINAKLQLIQSSTDLDSTVKSAAIDAYKLALGANEATENFQAQTEDLKKKTQTIKATIESKLETIKAELSEPVSPPDIKTANLELKELEREMKRQQSLVDSGQQEVDRLKSDIASRGQRQSEIPKAIDDATKRLAELDKQLTAQATEEENAQLTEATSRLTAARQAATKAELDALNAENQWLTVNLELLPPQRDLAQRKLDALEAELKIWQTTVQRKRETEVERDIRETKEFLETAPPDLESLAKLNLETAEARRDTDSQFKEANTKREYLQSELTTLQGEFDRSEKEASRSAISQLIGAFFRKKRNKLQALKLKLTSATALQQQADKARAKLFLLGEDRATLDDLDTAVRSYAQDVDSDHIPTLREQLERRTRLLDDLKSDSENLEAKLRELDQTQSDLRTLIDDYTTFIDQHVLWIRSTGPFGFSQAKETVASTQRLSRPKEWVEFLGSVLQAFRARPLLPIVAIVLVGFLTAFAKRVRQRLLECGDQAASRNCRDFRWTLNAMLLTLGTAVVWPAFLHLIGRWLGGADAAADGTLPVANGLMAAATTLLPLELWRCAARPNGLMESHFSVPTRTCEITRRNICWFAAAIVPLVGLITALSKLVEPERVAYSSLGRVLFAIAMMLTAFFIYRMANPKYGVTVSYLARRPDSAIYKTRYIWLSLLVSTPIVLLVLSLLGYQFTAERLANRLVWTVAALLGLWLLHAIVLRWVVLSRRRLAIEQARARLAKASEQIDTGPGTAEAKADIESIDLTSVDQQTRRLLRAVTFVAGIIVFFSLWVNVLPALSRFDELRAWDIVVTNTDAGGTSLDGNDASVPRTKLETVSWADVALTVLILLGTMLAMRDVPGLLELLVLQHLPLDVALRFAIKTLTRYLIFVAGMIWACNNIHFGWSQVQWLVAGISVGLGFGLQDIFANFVSGLIILFERPLRAGDIVTIDGVTGVVKSIRLRSTIIQDWDRKDLIVPNKDFVTGRLLNWTLHDEVNRIVIPIGVAYGTDTDQAKSLLLSVAKEHPLITSDPAPMATFEAFGDSSLNLILRCYISMSNMSKRLSVVDDLHTGIDVKFREAEIEIPFPQRDLHVRSTDATLSSNPLGMKASQKPNPN